MSKQRAHFQLIEINSEDGKAPEYIHLIPRGPDVIGRDGRRWKLPNPQTVVEAYHALNMKLPVDFEHSTELKGKNGEPAPVVGWIVGLEAREDGVWGHVEWNSNGREMIESKSYRYLSPVFSHDKSKNIHALLSVGLTNQPNLDLTALNHAHLANPEEKRMDKELLEALGLGEDATVQDAVTAINSLKNEKQTALNRAEHPDLQKFAPRAELNAAQSELTKFKEAEAARNKADIEAEVDAAIEVGKITPAARDYYIESCTNQGLDAFKTMIDGAPAVAGESNLDKAKNHQAKGKLSDTEVEVCRQLGMSEDDFLKTKEAEDKE